MNQLPLIGNIGAGSQVFKQQTNENLHEMRSIVAGANISVTQNANDVTIANTRTTMSWEDTFYGRCAASETCTWQKGNIGGDTIFNGWEFGDDVDHAGFYHWLHDGYASGQIQTKLFVWYRSNVPATLQNSFKFNLRWFASNDDLATAYSTNYTFNVTPTSGARRGLYTSYQNTTPDGTYASGKFLRCRLQRTDTNSPTPAWGMLKFKYTINL